MAASLELLANYTTPEYARELFLAAAIFIHDQRYKSWKKGCLALSSDILELAYVTSAVDTAESEKTALPIQRESEHALVEV